MAKKSITSQLFKLSRTSRDAKVLASGSPTKMARRAKNKWLGRKVARKLWKL